MPRLRGIEFSSGFMDFKLWHTSCYSLHMNKIIFSAITFLVSFYCKAQCPWNFTITNTNFTSSITCTNFSVNLAASNNNTNNVNYSWIGPGFTSNAATVSLNQAGIYTITAIDALTSCSLTQLYTLTTNTVLPTFSLVPIHSTITCLFPATPPTLTATAINPSINIQHDFYWQNGGGVNASFAPSAVIVFTAIGTHTYALTNLLNGCVATQTFHVQNAVTFTAGFTHTVLSNGLVNFQSTSSGTTAASVYNWAYGDGTTGSGLLSSHTYSNGGIHYAVLSTSIPSCNTSPSPINVSTLPCLANSNFSVIYSGTPLLWYAMPSYYGNITSATWDWGDGNSSYYSLYPSHTYSAPGVYNICLNVITSCANTSSTCSNYNVYKTFSVPDMQMITIQVVNAIPLGLNNTLEAENDLFSVFPNPSSMNLNIQNHAQRDGTVIIYNSEGKEIETIQLDNKPEISIQNLKTGLYFIEIKSEGKSFRKKLVVAQ